jgi:hypothetical protein
LAGKEKSLIPENAVFMPHFYRFLPLKKCLANFGKPIYNKAIRFGMVARWSVMDSMTAKEAATLWGVTDRQVQLLCDKGLVKGAAKFGSVWAIPVGALKPIDGRTKEAKKNIAKQSRATKEIKVPAVNGEQK